jgi:hypothetical protein
MGNLPSPSDNDLRQLKLPILRSGAVQLEVQKQNGFTEEEKKALKDAEERFKVQVQLEGMRMLVGALADRDSFEMAIETANNLMRVGMSEEV